ncbi:two-component system, chemotaxis family, sensor kinase CheA [Thalassolituus maritimus]|uniref:Chemotaxis protein CheA n=1 Tax=Thalassolituus maritimus TaxID=484498 RepID=A0A1N7LJG8_9GAMM|nr:chemotaxis protein CheA [Thalassolituus maritimus]SIS73985.1 two-component system, chemotaxis family, sensor kinase CheA [Thalassolituus maritimus]
MSFDADEEILQDFLVEAGEILELLSEQLVDLENSPDDKDLLNAIFRGFHTVKGGAGFLQLNPLVDCCHAAENVFDTLRNGKRSVNADLMDVVLSALDTVNEMFDCVRSGEMPEPAEQSLLDNLHHLALPEDEAPAVEAAAVEESVVEEAEAPSAEGTLADADNGDITDDEFEQLLDALDEKSDAASAATKAPAAAQNTGDDDNLFGGDDLFDTDSGPVASASDDEITEDEFEALLDQIHGKGKPGDSSASNKPEAPAPAEPEKTATPESPAGAGDSDLITDSEFEELLDRLHGKGKPGATDTAAPQGSSAAGAKPPAAKAPEETGAKKPEAATPKPAATPAAKPEAAKPAAKSSAPAAASAPKAKPDARKNEKEAMAEATVRVDTKRLDDIMNMVGELVLVRNRLVRLGLKSSDESMAKAVANLDVVTGDLQSSVMKTRMQPIKKVFGRFPRVVRDLARQLKKEINLELRGEETDLDKNLVEALADPLVHLVRNSVDHGVEQPDVREASGKSRVGTVILSAEQEGDHILLRIQDDGAGMDADVLRRKAVEKGVMDQDAADRLTDNECFNLIFAPGFSTKEQISDVSGRGVGMDVVKTKITQLNGTISIDSFKGEGTTISIKVPLTLAIMPTLMVMLKDQAFAFPLVNVNEIFHLDLTQTNVVDGQEVVVVRERAIPLFHLKRWLVKGEQFAKADESAHVVVVSVGTNKVGFVVDQLIGQEEVVIKPLGKMLHGTAGMAGATITGDGRIALILDIPSMLTRYATRQSSAA